MTSGWRKTVYGWVFTPPKTSKEVNEVAQQQYEMIKKARQLK